MTITEQDCFFSDLVEDVESNGSAVTHIRNGEDLLIMTRRIALAFGEVVPTRRGNDAFDVLSPIDPATSRESSLSAQFGSGEFPFHTDTAHWVVPSRYIVLACVNPGTESRPTRLLDWRDVSLSQQDSELLKTAAFRVVNGRRSFFSSVLSSKRIFVRYDPGCMVPVDSMSKRVKNFMSGLKNERATKEVEWTTGKVVVIDNWRVLHGRAAADTTSSDRSLIRFTIQ